MSARKEFYGAVTGALFAAITVGVIGGGLGLFVWSVSPSKEERLVDVKMDRSQVMKHPTAFVTVAEKRTGRIVLRIDQDGTLHPDYRKKFKLLQRKYKKRLCGSYSGDVREGRVGH